MDEDADLYVASELYENIPALKQYFRATQCYIGEEKYRKFIDKYSVQEFHAFIQQLGVAKHPRILKKERYWLGYGETQRLSIGRYTSCHFDDFILEGFDKARNRGMETSKIVWEWLSGFENLEKYRTTTFHYFFMVSVKIRNKCLSLPSKDKNANTMAEPKNLLPAGTTLEGGRYRIEAHLASGGFGNTYRAIDTKFDTPVAIKEFFMKGVNQRDDTWSVSVSNSDNLAMFDKQRQKFIEEAKKMHKLQHAHIVRVTDCFDENGTSYYVMDFVEGESLHARMKHLGKPMTERQVMEWLPQLLDALEYVHGHDVLHLDIKPANIMVDNEDLIHLIDFGASRQMDSSDPLTLTHTAMPYTKGFAPMEQMQGDKKSICAATDLYALGATIYNLLTAQQPPEVVDIGKDVDAAFHFPSSVSEEMRRFIIALMKPFPNQRPQSVEEARKYLGASASHDASSSEDDDVTVVEQPRKKPDKPSPNSSSSSKQKLNPEPKPSSGRWLWMGALATLLLVGGMVWWKMTQSTQSQSESSSSGQSEQVSDQTDISNPILGNLVANMVDVEGGTFMMGANPGDSEADDDQNPRDHWVTLSGFSIGRYEVTQEEWEAVMGSNPSNFKGKKRPVEQVSWDDCQEFIRKLNEKTGKRFRLPTEAEWEFAACGGNKSQVYFYSGSDSLDAVAWYDGNSGFTTHDVGQKSPNELGLYDMTGNVWEWCSDWYGDYSSSSQTNPTGPSSGAFRVSRGGSWYNDAGYCRVSFRASTTPDARNLNLGLRLAL